MVTQRSYFILFIDIRCNFDIKYLLRAFKAYLYLVDMLSKIRGNFCIPFFYLFLIFCFFIIILLIYIWNRRCWRESLSRDTCRLLRQSFEENNMFCRKLYLKHEKINPVYGILTCLKICSEVFIPRNVRTYLWCIIYQF